MHKFRLAAVVVACSLAACGGGEDEASVSSTTQIAAVQPMQNPFGDFSTAMTVNATLTGTRLDHVRALSADAKRMRALSATISAAEIVPPTPEELFAWAQKLLPSLFPGNPATAHIDNHGGWAYTYRHYAATNTYLGVRSDGGVFVLHANGELKHYGWIADYTCDVKGCGSVNPIIVGSIAIEITKHTVTPALVEGKILGTSAGELSPADLDRICIEGPNHGFIDTRTCGAYQNGSAVITGVSNNDRVQYVGRKKGSGERVWFTVDPSATTRFTVSGLHATFVGGFIEYSEFVQEGQPVYRKPTVRIEGGNLILAFGRNRLSGFGLATGRTDFTSGNYQFRFQPRSGDVKAMTTAIWRDATKELVVEFKTDLKCSDTGTVTVHRQIIGGGYSTSVSGWLSIGRGIDAEPTDIIWNFQGPGVVPVVDTGAGFYGFRYQRTGC